MKIDIFEDKEFQDLPLDQKQKITSNYFDSELADDEFLSLPTEQQTKIKQNFTDQQLDFDLSDTYDKHIAPLFEDTADKAEKLPQTKETTNKYDHMFDSSIPKIQTGNLPQKEKTYREKFESGELSYRDTTPDNWGDKIGDDITALKDQYVKPVLFGSGEDFQSKEFNFSDEVIEPFRASAQEVAQNDIMSDAIIALGDDANDPEKLKEFLEKRDTLNTLNPMAHLQNATAGMEVEKGTAKHTPKTAIEAFKKEGVLSLDSWGELLKAIPSVTAGSVPHTAAFVVNLPQAIKGYGYGIAKDKLEQDGIKREPTRGEYANGTMVATVIGTLDKFGFSKASSSLKEEIAKQIVANPKTNVYDVTKSFLKTTKDGMKYELPTELAQEGIEVAYVKDKDLTGEDLLEAGVGALLGTAGMTTGIAAGKEIVSATKDTKQVAIDNTFSQFAQDIDNTQINQDALQQDTLNKINPNQAQYEAVQSDPLEQSVKGFEELQKELFGETEQLQDDLTPKGYTPNETQSNNSEANTEPQSTISNDTGPINEPINQTTVKQNFTRESAEQPNNDGIAGSVEENPTNETATEVSNDNFNKNESVKMYQKGIKEEPDNRTYQDHANMQLDYYKRLEDKYKNEVDFSNPKIDYNVAVQRYLLKKLDKVKSKNETPNYQTYRPTKEELDIISQIKEDTGFDVELRSDGYKLVPTGESRKSLARNEPINQTTVKQNFTGESAEQSINDGVVGDIETNKQKIEDNPLLKQLEQQSLEILKKKKAFNSEDYQEALHAHNETFTPVEDIKLDASEYLKTVQGGQDWQIPTLDKTGFGVKEIKPYALNSFNASEVNKNKDQYKFISEQNTNYGKPIKGYVVNKDRYGFKINDTFIDMGVDMDIEKAWAFIHLYPEATKFQSGWYYPENEAIAKHKGMKFTLNKNEKIKELFENFNKVYDQLTPQQIQDIKQTADKMELERKSTELIDSLIDKVFNETATEQEIQKLDEIIEQGEKQNATNIITTEDGRLQDIQDVKEQGAIPQTNNDTTKENVSRPETTNQKPIKFDVEKEYSTKGIKHETPSVEISKKIQKDVARYVGQLQKNLGYEFDTDKKGKKKTFNGVEVNIPPAGGNVRFKLWKPNSDYGVEVRLSYQPDYLDNGYESYKLQDLIAGGSSPVRYNVVSKNGKDQFRYISVYADKIIDESFVNEIKAEVNRQETKATETKKDDIIKEDKGVKDESNTGTKRDTNQEANDKDSTRGTSTSKQGSSTTTRGGENDTGVQSRQTGHDADNTTPSTDYGISAEDERVGRYDTDGGDKQDNKRRTDADTVLPRADNSDAPSLKNYDLTNKEPVSLTRGERKKINALTKEILQKPQSEITEADKDILRQYTGDGGLDDVTAGSVNQHYTNYETVRSMYDALYEAGFDFKRALEPAVGSGNFVGFASDKQWDIVDIDTTNINVATTLYPNTKPTNDTYETFKGKNYDLIISNVPFASTQSLMREHAMTIKPAFKAIHNFYFAHSIDKVKDNGVVAFMTSTGTMDGVKEAQNLRAYLMKKADIIGAFRLPENSQRENTHTDTMIDIIVLQKRPDGVKSRQEKINESFVKIGKKDGHSLNQYFIDNPESMLGTVEIGRDRTKMGKEGIIVKGTPRYEDMKLSYEPYKIEKKKATQDKFEDDIAVNKYADENGLIWKSHETGYTHIEFGDDGRLYKWDQKFKWENIDAIGMFGKKATGTNAKKLTDLNEIMFLAEDYQKTKNENSKAKALELIKAYQSNHNKAPHSDTVLKKYAKENRFDSQLKEYMSYFDKEFVPAPLFKEDVRFKDSGVLKVTTKSSYEERAMSVEDEDGKIDLTSEDPIFPFSDVAKGLDQGLYAVSANKEVQNSIMYYSGNIYKKLDDLDTMLENKHINQEQYDRQYKKLKEILPSPTPYKNIKFKGIESWIPKEIQEKLVGKDADGEWFLKDGFGIDGMQKNIVNNYLNGKTLVKRDQKNETIDEHRVKVLEANKLLKETLLPKIHEKVEQLGLSETVESEYNKFASAYVEPKLTGYLLKDMPKIKTFKGKEWKGLQSHQLEGAELVVYNKKGVIAFAPGGGKTITAIVAVKQLLNQGVMKKPLFVVPVNTIHQWEETVRELYPEASVFEFPKIQRGENKGQAKEWKDLSKDEKEQMIYDLTNNRYDFTIIGDTAFQKIGIPQDKVQQYANDLAEQITAAEEIDEDGGKQEQKSGLSLEAKKAALAKGIASQYEGDVTVDIEKLGFDAVIADEVQYYKNIGMQGKDTKGDLGTNISVKYYERNKEFNSALPTGKNNPEYIQLTQKDLKEGAEPSMAKLESWRSYDFRFKTRFISENNNGNNIILLTGTPTPNKPLELMTLLHHMDQNILDEYGIENVSDFVDTFLETETFESVDAQGKPKTVEGLGGVRNAQWLKKIIKRYVNYKGFEDMPDLPRPKQVDVKHYLSLSPAGEEIFGDILHRLVKSLEDSKSKTVSPEHMEQPITMYGLGRDASIDLRLYNVGTKGKSQYTQEEIQKLVLEDERTTTNNKTKKVVDLVTKQYKENPQSGQIIFNDRIKYKDENGAEKYIHSELRDEILSSGLLEPNEVVIVTGQLFVNPNTGKLRKGNLDNKLLQRIIKDYNDGKIKVIIGNTAKLGVGVDLNKYTTDIYQMDIPYRPDEIEQRNNRGVRQGNINPEVRVHSFFQIGTFDKFSFDLIKKKEGFNNVYWKDVDGAEVTLDRGDSVDPYEMMIQIEKDVYKREKLRLERIIDQSAFIQKDIDKAITKLEETNKVKEQTIKGERGYEVSIANIDKELQPKNYPKYENIKDENEKKAKLEKHIATLKERKEKYKQKIEDAKDEIAHNEELIAERKAEKSKRQAEVQRVIEDYTEEITKDKHVVRLEMIEELHSERELLEKEGKNKEEIEQYFKERESNEDTEPETLSSKIVDQQERDILNSKGVDGVGSNYVANISTQGFPERSLSSKIEIAGEFVELPTVDNPQTVESVREFLKDIIGSRLYDGRVKGKSRLGFYNRVNTGMRVKSYHDIEVQAHEMAHYLDYFHNNPTKKASTSFFKNFKDTHKEFLKSVSYTQQKSVAIPEGFAEFVRLYTTQYENLSNIDGAMEVIEAFETILAKDKKLQKKIHRYRDEAHKYYHQGHIERMSAVSDNTLNKDADKIKSKSKKRLDNIKQNLVDKNLSIKMIEEHLKGKDPIDADKSAYKLFNLVNGAEGTVDMVLAYGVPYIDKSGDIQLDESKKGLDQIFKPLFDAGHKEVRLWENYAKARRAKELKEQNRENRIDKQMIDESLALEKEYPHFKTIFDEYQVFNNAMLDFYVGMKLITKDQKENFQEANSEYVPFYRVKESIAQGKVVPQVANGKLGARLKGGTGTIANIMDNIYGAVEKNIKDAYVARAKSSLFEMLEKDGAEFAMKIGKDTKKVKGDISSQAKNVASVLASMDMGISKGGMIVKNGEGIYEDVMVDINDIATILEANPELLEMWSMGHIPQSKDKMIDSAIIDGKRVYFEINDPMLIDTLSSQKGVMIENQLMKFGVAYKNLATFMITNNPLFYLTNAFRDTVSAGVISENGFIPFYHTLKGMWHYIKKDKMYKNFMTSGAGYSTRRTALGSYDDVNTDSSMVARHFGAFEKFTNALAYGADLFEYGTRIGEFEVSKRKGKSNIHSAYGGREVSTDFSRSGSSDNFRKFLGTVAFAKAGINSIDRFYRRFRDKKTKADKIRLYMAGGAIATFTMALAAMNDDDERYKKLTKDQKSMYWWIYLDKFIDKDTLKSMGINPIWKLPKPYDVGILFANVPELINDYIRDNANSEELRSRFVFDMARTGGFMDFPSVFKGALEVGFNKDWKGVPIESLGMQFQPKELRAKTYTPEIYKEMGNKYLSPAQMHHLSNSFLGLYGRMLDDLMEASLWDEQEKGERAFAKYNPLDYLSSRLQGKEVENRTVYDEKFYKHYQDMIEVHGELGIYKKQKDKEGFESFRKNKEKRTLYSLKSYGDKVQTKLSSIRKAIANIQEGKTPAKTAVAKEKEINRLLLHKQKILEQAVINIEDKLSRGKK